MIQRVNFMSLANVYNVELYKTQEIKFSKTRNWLRSSNLLFTYFFTPYL